MIAGLYAITSDDLMPGDQLLQKSEAALKGGCRVLQYRNKNTDAATKLKEARALKQLCDRYQTVLIINDSVELALESQAAGVHLGQGDGSIASAREILGPSAIIGATCHSSIQLARDAIAQGASYVAFGRFFASHTKPNAPGAPLELLAQAIAELPVPVVAIGGINRHNIQPLLAQKPQCIAMSHELFAHDDLHTITETTQYYHSLFTYSLFTHPLQTNP